MASPLITAYIYPSLLCVCVPFLSSFTTNIVAMLPSSSPGWLCSGSMLASALVHLSIAIAILVSQMYRFQSSSVFAILGMLLTAAFHAMIASGWRGAVDVMITMQAGLSIARSVMALLDTWLEAAMAGDQSVRVSCFVWIVGSGGADSSAFDGRESSSRTTTNDHVKLMEENEMLLLPNQQENTLHETSASMMSSESNTLEGIEPSPAHIAAVAPTRDTLFCPTEVVGDVFAQIGGVDLSGYDITLSRSFAEHAKNPSETGCEELLF